VGFRFGSIWLKRVALCVLLIVATCVVPNSLPTSSAQSADDIKRDRNRGVVMLALVKDYIKEYYYDPNYHGMDLDARFKSAEEKINQANNISQVLGIIAQAVVELNDSHTFFVPPSRAVDVEYGWKMQMIGNTCFVVAVKPGSDAEAQGLKAGDEVISVDGFRPNRATLWKMEYNYAVLHPQPGKRVVVRTPEGQERELALKANVTKREKSVNAKELENQFEEDRADEKNLARISELSEEVMIWKLRQFDLTESKIDDTMKKARQHKSLILDLRGNGGGQVVALEKLTGNFFDHDVVIAQAKGRKEPKPMKAKTRADKAFAGKLIVLVDSQSASAAEIFARFVQIEKRATVIGDRTAGAVMQSRFRPGALGDMSSGNMVFYGASITEANVIMSDGTSLESVGVTPDELLLPTAADLAAKRDPVLARAAALLGAEITPEKAGTIFPLDKEKW